MIVPSATWFRVAAVLAVLAPLTLVWNDAASVLLIVDALWLLAFVVDAITIGGVDLATFPVERDPPAAFSVGRALPVTYRWTNPFAFAVRARVREELPSLIAVAKGDRTLRLAPGVVTREVIEVVPRRRGKATGGRISLRLLGRWHLAWRQGSRLIPWDVTVYPALGNTALRALPTQLQRRRQAGLRNLRRLGEGRLFESLREWIPGEETRSIDWKATARRGKLMARQYEDERRQQVMMVIDAGRMLTSGSEGRSRLDAAIDAALELACSAAQHDDNVGLLVFADQVLHYVAPSHGRRAIRQILDILAGVDGRLVEPDYPAAFAYLAARSRKRALTVLFTDIIDRTASDALVGMLGTLRPRHLPLAVTLRDPALERLATIRPVDTDAAYQRAAAEELLGAREAALIDLRGRGVLVLDVLPDNAAREVVAQYQRLKQRALV